MGGPAEAVPESHHRGLEACYLSANCNQYYEPGIEVGPETCRVWVDVKPEFMHAAHAVHGSVYFKLLDDAAFFAANSVVPGFFVLTAEFHLKLLRPVTAGKMIATGHLIDRTSRLLHAESELRDEEGRLLGKGWGTFLPSQVVLDERVGYVPGRPTEA
jgi:uncharacterized protein (TIGR00369 family)